MIIIMKYSFKKNKQYKFFPENTHFSQHQSHKFTLKVYIND